MIAEQAGLVRHVFAHKREDVRAAGGWDSENHSRAIVRLTVGGSAGVVGRGRGLVVTWICRIAVFLSWLVLPRSRGQGALRIGKIASLMLIWTCGREYPASQAAGSPPAR